VSDRPIEPEELGELADLSPDDPRVQALESQPRAQAQLRAYRDFVAPGDVPAGARVAEAEARLGEMLETELGVAIGATERAPSVAPPASRPRRAGVWSWLRPGLRPAFAIAALVIVAGGAWVVTQSKRGTNEPILRGIAPGTPTGVIANETPEQLPNGALRLSWAPVADATAYTVVFLSADLSEVARIDALSSPHLVLDPNALLPGLTPHTNVLWRVIAWHGADELGRSPALPLTLP
jgi:hypothetical protein